MGSITHTCVALSPSFEYLLGASSHINSSFSSPLECMRVQHRSCGNTNNNNNICLKSNIQTSSVDYAPYHTYHMKSNVHHRIFYIFAWRVIFFRWRTHLRPWWYRWIFSMSTCNGIFLSSCKRATHSSHMRLSPDQNLCILTERLISLPLEKWGI